MLLTPKSIKLPTSYHFNQRLKLKQERIDSIDKWNLLRAIALKQITQKAQLRLEWIIFFNTIGEKRVPKVCNHFNISRKTFYKWLNRFKETNLKTLLDVSKKSHNLRQKQINKIQELKIISLRKKYMMYGRKKLFYKYQKEYGEKASLWSIEEVIRKHRLYADKKKYYSIPKKKAKGKTKTLIRNLINPKDKFGFLWHIDCIIINWFGVRRVVITAIEDITKIGYARIYKTNSSRNVSDFLERLMFLVEGKVEIMHSDNGSEFAGEFEQICKKRNIEQVFSRVTIPNDNPSLERFNRTLQEGWLRFTKIVLEDVTKANYDLTEWLKEYNYGRPHQSLDFKTPIEYAQNNFNILLPIYPVSTSD